MADQIHTTPPQCGGFTFQTQPLLTYVLFVEASGYISTFNAGTTLTALSYSIRAINTPPRSGAARPVDKLRIDAPTLWLLVIFHHRGNSRLCRSKARGSELLIRTNLFHLRLLPPVTPLSRILSNFWSI